MIVEGKQVKETLKFINNNSKFINKFQYQDATLIIKILIWFIDGIQNERILNSTTQKSSII